jgi:universal stress protein E
MFETRVNREYRCGGPMQKPRHILVVIDPTAVRHAVLLRAADLALAFGARVELFVAHVGEPAGGFPLAKLAEDLRERAIETTTDEACSATIHEGILRKVIESRPSLVLKDTHPHSFLRRSVLPNTDWHLIRSCPVPQLFVRPGEWGRPPQIAAAVDIALPGEKPALLDHALLDAAETFSLATHGALHAVHAYLPIMDFASTSAAGALPIAPGLEPAESNADYEAFARERFEALLERHAVPREHRHVLLGRPGEALVRFARESKIDLLVMGTFTRGWMYNVLVGSTTERILDLLPCDVLVLRPTGLECPATGASREWIPPERRVAGCVT